MKQIPSWLWDYAKYVIEKHDFDSSHDLNHFMNVYDYTQKIIDVDYDNDISLIDTISREDSIKICLYAAFCHDLIDSKYVDSEKSLEELKSIFLSNQYNAEHLDIIVFLINNMSFSKERFGKQHIPKKYQVAMNIISDADKLDAYRVERVITYQERKNKDTKINKRWIKTILVKRILEYKDKWLKTNYAKSIAPPLHDRVQKYVDEMLIDVEMVDY